MPFYGPQSRQPPADVAMEMQMGWVWIWMPRRRDGSYAPRNDPMKICIQNNWASKPQMANEYARLGKTRKETLQMK